MAILEKIDSMKGEAQAKVDDLTQFKSDAESELLATYNKGWDEAMLQAGSGGSTDKIYSEAEMNQIIADVKAPLEESIAQKQLVIDGIEGRVEQARTEAKDEIKLAIKSKFAEQQAAENVSEEAFKSLLE